MPTKVSTVDHTAAALQVLDQESSPVVLPVLGHVALPAPERLAWYGGVAALALVGVIDWPVAAIIVAGHFLSDNARNRALKGFGEALDEAG